MIFGGNVPDSLRIKRARCKADASSNQGVWPCDVCGRSCQSRIGLFHIGDDTESREICRIDGSIQHILFGNTYCESGQLFVYCFHFQLVFIDCSWCVCRRWCATCWVIRWNCWQTSGLRRRRKWKRRKWEKHVSSGLKTQQRTDGGVHRLTFCAVWNSLFDLVCGLLFILFRQIWITATLCNILLKF